MPDPADAPRFPVQALDGFADVLDRLENHLAITVQFVSLPGKAGALDGPSRTLLVNKDKPIVDQVWVMIQAWKVVTLGPEASAAAVPERRAFMHLIATG